MLALRLDPQGRGRAFVEHPLADVDRVGDDRVDRRHAEPGAAPGAIAALV